MEENRQTITLDANGELDWSTIETIEGSCTKIDIECPHCGATLYHNEGNSTDQKSKSFSNNPPFFSGV